MSATFTAADALQNYRKNQFNKWNIWPTPIPRWPGGPDRLHVRGEMVRHVVSRFQRAFFDLSAIEEDRKEMADTALI